MKLITTLVLCLSSTLCFARNATTTEVKAFCIAIDKAMEEAAVDASINLSACKRTKMLSTPLQTGERKITGKVPFNSPDTDAYIMNCEGLIKRKTVLTTSIVCR